MEEVKRISPRVHLVALELVRVISHGDESSTPTTSTSTTIHRHAHCKQSRFDTFISHVFVYGIRSSGAIFRSLHKGLT
jgi:hypothetical protein